ncbi:MAG TPA: hypothetical protein PLL66_06840 [Bacteroidales bacterium]|nr:hypothetical protein [Bacteroidales bacterium]
MKNKINLLIIIFITISFTSFSQFSIDVYSGYNYSNTDYIMPDKFDYSDDKTYYSDTPYDTIYSFYYPDSILGIRYIIREHYSDTASTKHNFAKDYLYGANISYSYAKSFRTGVSFESYGSSFNNPDFTVTITEQRYGNDDELFYYDGIICNFNYKVSSIILTQSFLLKYNKISFNLNAGFICNYSLFEYDYEDRIISYYNAIHSPREYDKTYNVSKSYSGFSPGFRTSMGLSFDMFKNVSVFGTFGYTFLNLKFQKGILLVDDYLTYDYSDVIEGYQVPVLPQPIEKSDIPFGKIDYSSWNFRIGLRYTFGKKEKSVE